MTVCAVESNRLPLKPFISTMPTFLASPRLNPLISSRHRRQSGGVHLKRNITNRKNQAACSRPSPDMDSVDHDLNRSSSPFHHHTGNTAILNGISSIGKME